MASASLLNAAEIGADSLSISPSKPTDSTAAPRKLYPGESFSLTVNVQTTERVGEKDYKLKGNPSFSFSGGTTLWTRIGDSKNPLNFQALNSGRLPGSQTVTVNATWVEDIPTNPSLGRGAAGSLRIYLSRNSIPGWATGFAESDRPTFTWTYNQRLQFDDGQSPLVYSVTGSGEGGAVDMTPYSVRSSLPWTITGGSGSLSLSGTVKSSQAGKGKLKVYYENYEQSISEDEIGFAKVDLAIAQFADQGVLKEDRNPTGTTTTAPHEMDPGSVVIALITGSSGTGSCSKLTLTGEVGAAKEGTFKLEAENLANLEVYTTPTGNEKITLPHTWNAANLPENLYVGATSFASGAAAQDGKIKLTYKRRLLTGATEFELVDSVRVRLLPVEIKVSSKGSPYDYRSGGPRYSDAPNKGSANNLYAVWDKENFVVKVKMPAPFDQSGNLPPNFIEWTVAGFLVPVNSTEFTFKWTSSTTKIINIKIAGSTYKVHVQIPDVGGISTEEAALVLVGLRSPISSAKIIEYGYEAKSATQPMISSNARRADALRHSYWNSLGVSDPLILSVEVALVTTAHEYENRTNKQPANDSAMDLHNNYIGRSVVETQLLPLGPDRLKIFSQLESKYSAGELWIWDGGEGYGNDNGVIIKSNEKKIYPASP